MLRTWGSLVLQFLRLASKAVPRVCSDLEEILVICAVSHAAYLTAHMDVARVRKRCYLFFVLDAACWRCEGRSIARRVRQQHRFVTPPAPSWHVWCICC